MIAVLMVTAIDSASRYFSIPLSRSPNSTYASPVAPIASEAITLSSFLYSDVSLHRHRFFPAHSGIPITPL